MTPGDDSLGTVDGSSGTDMVTAMEQVRDYTAAMLRFAAPGEPAAAEPTGLGALAEWMRLRTVAAGARAAEGAADDAVVPSLTDFLRT